MPGCPSITTSKPATPDLFSATSGSHDQALAWLPKDGTPATNPSWRMTDALHELLNQQPAMVRRETGPYGPRGGWRARWRLTEDGQRERTMRGL